MGALKILGILVIILLLGAAVYLTFIAPVVSAEGFEHNGVYVSGETYQGIKEQFKDDLGAQICNIDTGHCIFIWDIENMEEVLG